MIKYYKISTDSKESDTATVADYNLNDVDIRDFWHAKKANETLAARMDFFVSDAGNIEKTDYMANPLSLLIFSKRLLKILLPVIKNDVQIFETPLYKKETMEAVNGFYIIHLFKEFECIDTEKTKHTHPDDNENAFIPIGRLVIKNKYIPKDVHMFRAKEFNNCKIVTNSIVDLFIENQIQGVIFRECKFA